MSEWIDYGKSWWDFTKENLNATGTVVEVAGVEYLIGDINELRGVCDDCTEFKSDAIVTRYRIVYVEETK